MFSGKSGRCIKWKKSGKAIKVFAFANSFSASALLDRVCDFI